MSEVTIPQSTSDRTAMLDKPMKVAVVGTGYVGLVSGVCLASRGHFVTCVDLRREIVDTLNKAIPHIHEIGLPELLSQVINLGRFRATGNLADALHDADVVLLAVGTPSEGGRIDLQYIGRAAEQVGDVIRGRENFLSVIVKSTVVPGTTDTFVSEVIARASGRQLGEGWGLGMNPEFLREGNAVTDFMVPDRIVFGYEDTRTLSNLRTLYASWNCAKVEVNTRTAELIKYANNCLLATQISAVNEIANLATRLGDIDIMDVMQGVHLDKRWNPILGDGTRANPQILTYLLPGCGFGGSCFPKDVQALRTQGVDEGLEMHVLEGVLKVNTAQPGEVTKLVARSLKSLEGKRVLVLGLAFKPGTDDVRESASRNVIADLSAAGADVVAHDPIAGPNAEKAWTELSCKYSDDWRMEISTADAVVVLTRWPEYGELKADKYTALLLHKLVVDARRFFSPTDFPSANYVAIGFSPNRGNI